MRKKVIIRDLKLAAGAFLIGSALSLITTFPFETAIGIPVGIMLTSFLYELVR